MVVVPSSPESGEMRSGKGRRRSPASPSTSRSSTPKSKSKSKSSSPSRSRSRSRSRSSSRSLGRRVRRREGRSRGGKARSRSALSRGSKSRSASEEYYHYKGRSPGGDDPTNSTVYVGGMSPSTDERSLREFFQKFGTVVETKAVLDPDTHGPRCFGFVKFCSAGDADLAVSQAHGKVLDGNTIRCNLARYPQPSSRKRGKRDSPSRDKLRVKGRGERRYKRSVSPGRWGQAGRSKSNNSRSRSRSCSRPRSPRRKRRRSRTRSYSRQRGRWHGRSRSLSRSKSRSRTRSRSPVRYRGRRPRRSLSRGRRSISPRRSHSRAKRSLSRPKRSLSRPKHHTSEEPSPRGPTKQDLEQAKAREQELTARIVHIEGEAKKSMVAREKAASSLASLTTEFRAVAERSKNRGAMLAKLIGAVREVEDIKGRLEDAQATLQSVANSAISMMQQEERKFQKLENKTATKDIEESTKSEDMEPAEACVAPMVDLNEVGRPAEEKISDEDKANGLTVVSPAQDAVSSPKASDDEKDTTGRSWKPLTFRIKL